MSFARTAAKAIVCVRRPSRCQWTSAQVVTPLTPGPRESRLEEIGWSASTADSRASHASRSPPAPIMKKLDTLVETNGLSQAPAEAYRADPSRERNRGAARGSPVLPQGAMSRGLQTSKGGQAVARPTIRTGRSASRGRKSFDRATPRVVRWLRDCRVATRPRSAHSLVSLG
jgi:hypothetical protein